MTKKEQAVRKRAWLKMKVFCITTSLQREMAAFRPPAEMEKEYLSYIQNKVLIESRKSPTMWANIGAKYFSDKIGSNYREYIDFLVGMGELEINESYKKEGGNGFTKSYRVPHSETVSDITKITFQRTKIQPPRAKPIQPNGDVVLEFVEKNLRRLTVAETLLQGPDAIADAMIHEFCWQIFFHDFKLRYGNNCRRLYHAVIEMVKEGRANLQLADSADQLFEYDVKSCHPVLLLNYFTDDTERQRYKQLLDVDVYDGVTAVMNKTVSRDEAKEIFMQAINRSDRDEAALARNWVYRFFEQEFPIFTQQVLISKTDMAIDLQNLEAKLMVEDLGQFCRAHGLFWIPCHDGWMTTQQHEQQIVTKVQELFHSTLGYNVVISKMDLISRTPIILPSYLSGSYVQVNDTSPTTLEKVAVDGATKTVSINPWKETVDLWRQQHSPTQLQEASIKRSESKKRQKVGYERQKANNEASDQLATYARKAMKKLSD